MKTSVKRLINLLERSRMKIRRGWTQRHEARDADGNAVSCRSKDATCFCAIGALAASTKSCDLKYDAKLVLSQVIPKRYTVASLGGPGNSVIRFNDARTRTKADVLAMFGDAIRLLKKEGRAAVLLGPLAP